MATETKPVPTWPTREEYLSVTEAVNRAMETVELVDHRLRQLVDPSVAPGLREGCPNPTAADVGELCRFVAYLDLLIRGEVERLREVAEAVVLEDTAEDVIAWQAAS